MATAWSSSKPHGRRELTTGARACLSSASQVASYAARTSSGGAAWEAAPAPVAAAVLVAFLKRDARGRERAGCAPHRRSDAWAEYSIWTGVGLLHGPGARHPHSKRTMDAWSSSRGLGDFTAQAHGTRSTWTPDG